MATIISAKKRGKMIKAARKKLNYTAASLAKNCKVSRAAVHLWENGETQEITIEHAMTLHFLLPIPLRSLVSNEIWAQILEATDGDIETATASKLSTKSKRLAAIWDGMHESDPMKQLIYEVLERYSRLIRGAGSGKKSRNSR